MANKNILLFLAVCLVQVSLARHTPHNVRDVLEDLTKELKEEMKLAKREVERSTDLVLNNGARWMENVRRATKDSVEELERVIRVAGDCGQKQQAAIAQLRIDTENGVQDCIISNIKGAQELIQNLQANLTQSERLLIQVQIGQEQCNILEQINTIACMNKLIVDEEPIIEKLLMTMTPLIDQTLLFQASVGVCVDTSEVKLQTNVQQIILDVQKCLIS